MSNYPYPGNNTSGDPPPYPGYPPSQGGSPYPPQSGSAYPQQGGAPYPPQGGAPYPPQGGSPYPPSGPSAPSAPPAEASPYPPSSNPPPYPQQGNPPYGGAGSAPYPPSYGQQQAPYGAGQSGGAFGGSQGSGFLWSLHDKHQFLEVRGNGTEIFYSGRDHHIVEDGELGPIVRADRPIPKQGQFHFEVSIDNLGQNSEIAVGICTRNSPLDRFPGWVPMSFGYHGDDGNIFCESEDPAYEPEKPFRLEKNPIGVTLDFNTKTLTFSRKKKEIQRMQLQSHHMNQDFYPCVGISSPGAVVRLTMPIGSGGPPPVQPQQGYQQPPQYPGAYPPTQQQPGYPPAPYQSTQQNSPYPPAGAPSPYGGQPPPTSDSSMPGKGLFSGGGGGFMGKAMKQAEKYGAGKIVGQAAGALGIGGQSSGGSSSGYGAGQSGGPYGGGPPPAQPQHGYQQPPQYPGAYPPSQQSYPQAQASPSHSGLLSNCQGTKKALLIGINYFGQGGELRGCVNDVNNIKSLIKSRGFTEDQYHMLILTDDQRDPRHHPTRRNIIEGMNWLVRGAQPNDSLFFHYSGHGSQKQDEDGDEVDATDETIVPVDYKSAGEIVDDEMNHIMVQQLPRGARLTAIFDSCHSATALDLPFIYDCYGQPKKQKYSRKTAGMDLLNSGLGMLSGNMFQKMEGAQSAFSTLSALGNEGQAQEITAQTRSSQADVVMFSGCKDNQTSADTNVSGYGATGAASYAFINTVREHRNLTYIELLNIMRETLAGKYSQKVQMSTGFPTDMNIPFIF